MSLFSNKINNMNYNRVITISDNVSYELYSVDTNTLLVCCSVDLFRTFQKSTQNTIKRGVSHE